MKVKVYDSKGKKVSDKALPKDVFGVKPNFALIAQAVRVHHAKSRQGTRMTKGRSDLHYSGRKLWRQKGTGRARHGDRTANIFRKGAKAHGPRPQKFSAKFPKKMQKGALRSVLSAIVKEGQVAIIKELKFKPPKLTSQAAKLFEKMKMENFTLVAGNEDKNTLLAVKNLPYMNVVRGKNVSAHVLTNTSNILFTRKGYDDLIERLS